MRISLIIFLCLILYAAPSKSQQAAQWVRGSAKNVDYANMEAGVADLFGFFCRKVEERYVGGMVMKMPVFNTLIRDDKSYSLIIIVNGERESVTFRAKNIDLWFEAEDLNQQLILTHLFETIKASNRLQIGISSIGWRNSYDYSNATNTFDGLMNNCL